MIGQFPLWKSRKFWLLILDIAVSCVLFFGGQYLGEQEFGIAKFLIATLQPVFIMLIGAYTYQNVKLAE
jgi:drug/metabolite transporter (DMT)-like permease